MSLLHSEAETTSYLPVAQDWPRAGLAAVWGSERWMEHSPWKVEAGVPQVKGTLATSSGGLGVMKAN